MKTMTNEIQLLNSTAEDICKYKVKLFNNAPLMQL